MQPWEKHWFGPVAAIRPYVFQKCLALMLAFDLLVLMVERGARYGTDAIEFNVAHFRWLDYVHSLLLPGGVPTANYYVFIVAVTSFLTFCLFFAGHRPWLTAIVGLLFTYAWTMSRLDSYMHHYMLSLVLLCVTFFPRVDARDLKAWLLAEPTDAAPDAASDTTTPLAVGRPATGMVGLSLLVLAFLYRFLLSQTVGLGDMARWAAMGICFVIAAGIVFWGNRSVRPGYGPMVSAWSYRLLLTTAGVIYVFAATTKMDGEWCAGHTLKAVGRTETVLQPIANLAAFLGIPVDTFWSVLATFVIPLELMLGAVYLLSVWQDHVLWFRRICFVGWLLAIGLHLNNEMMNLVIQWFGFYMLLLATTLLMPSRILLIAGEAFIWPECWVRERVDRLYGGETGPSLLTVSLAVVLTLPVALVCAMLSMIPGIMAAALAILCVLVIILVVGIAVGQNTRVLKICLASMAAFAAMTCAMLQCSMQFDYYDIRGRSLMSQGRLSEATQSFEAATAFRAPTNKAAADLFTNLAICYVRDFQQQPAGVPQEASEAAIRRIEQTFRHAIASDPTQFLAYYSYGNFLTSQNRLADAQRQFHVAVKVKPDFSDAYINLGSTYEYEGRIAEALQCYEIAAEIEPNAQDVQQLLASAKAKLTQTE